MKERGRLAWLLRISGSEQITRRYFVVNGFDGALAMLGLMAGFYASRPVDLTVALTSGLATAFALGMSGLSSAYMSEAAERRNELSQLEDAMLRSMAESDHGRAAALAPWLIAFVNGAAPFAVGILVVMPLWLALRGVALPLEPLLAAIGIALGWVFMLGVFLGRVGGTHWLRSGLQSLGVALLTVGLILWVG